MEVFRSFYQILEEVTAINRPIRTTEHYGIFGALKK